MQRVIWSTDPMYLIWPGNLSDSAFRSFSRDFTCQLIDGPFIKGGGAPRAFVMAIMSDVSDTHLVL